jgi:hypothetical protein
MMWKAVVGVAVIGVLLWGATPYARGQQATEVYIPLGQSPGLSGKVTIIGAIETINAQNRTIAIAGSSGTWSAEITDRTKIWLDRSKIKLPNQTGTFADLGKGLMVEVKYEGTERQGRGPADWIKVQLTVPSAR